MTAQPEVVWVLVEEENGEPVYWLETEAFAGYTPYVSQASLTAALAERDHHKEESDLWEETYLDTKGMIDDELLPRIQALVAERDKLAKALKRAMTALDDWTHTYASEMCHEDRVSETRKRIYDGGGTLHYIGTTMQECREALGATTANNPLTAQAAQGEKG